MSVASLPHRHRTVEGLLEHLAQVASRLKGLVVIPVWEGQAGEHPWVCLWFTPITTAEACVASVALHRFAANLLEEVVYEAPMPETAPPEDAA